MWLLLLLAIAADAQPRPASSRPTASRPATSRPVARPSYSYRPPVRHYYSTVPSRTVYVSVGVRPWTPTWVPPPRQGWAWVPGRYDPYGYWVPGHWRSTMPAPSGWVYVDGFWQGDVYIDGWYRTPRRAGYVWVDTRYHPDGSVVPGHWRPIQTVPPGYVWEPGLFDGNGYTDGFWRPAVRPGYRWVSAAWHPSGAWTAGYWLPAEAVPEHIWEPGYFDGNTWVEGRWVIDEPPRTPKAPRSDSALALPASGN